MRICFAIALLTFFSCVPAAFSAAPGDKEVYIEDMTWPEIRDRMRQGVTTIIIPTGGTEQNGPHIITGKHNYVMHYTSGEIARRLGNALSAPVMAYVPEGRISPPEGHMRFPGTISLSETAFAAVLEDTARSFKQEGFQLICFVGDHGGSQTAQAQVADKLNAEWHSEGAKVLQVSNYYAANGQKEWVAKNRSKVGNPEAHAGFLDAAEMLARRADGVRMGKMMAYKESDYSTVGAAGDPTLATAEIGREMLSLKINAAVTQIRNAQADHY